MGAYGETMGRLWGGYGYRTAMGRLWRGYGKAMGCLWGANIS